jgi:hypothetical protein
LGRVWRKRLVTMFVRALPFGEERYTLTAGATALLPGN